jgi:hypothetical protein
MSKPICPIILPYIVGLTREEAYDKCDALKEIMRVIEGSILYDPIKAAKIYLVLNVIVPKEF